MLLERELHHGKFVESLLYIKEDEMHLKGEENLKPNK
jgi:hypothetical protein